MRVLLVSWDGGGNLAAVLVLGERLVAGGHEVRVLGNRSQREAVRATGCEFAAFERAPDCDSRQPETDLLKDWEVSAPPTLFARARDRLFFGPAADYAADVLATLDRDPADVVAADFMLFGALAAAERSGCRSVALFHTVYAPPSVSVPPFLSGFGLSADAAGGAREEAVRGVMSALWNEGLPALNDARAGLGLEPLGDVLEQFDRLDRVLVLISSAFDFAAITGAALPANVRYVGPQLKVADRTGERYGPPRVLVSLSTTYQAQKPLLQRVVNALGTLPVKALVTTGPAIDFDAAAPPNVRVERYVAHELVLPDTSLVITHAGMGTVMAALAHGVPLVCMPMGRDQPDVAARVAHTGAGVQLSSDASEAQIAATVRDALANPHLADNARRMALRIADERSADLAISELESLQAVGRIR
ncbi:MAG: glycosyltransferase [Solirubrobacteraceae bacterium]